MVEEGGQIVNINFIFGLYVHNHFLISSPGQVVCWENASNMYAL